MAGADDYQEPIIDDTDDEKVSLKAQSPGANNAGGNQLLNNNDNNPNSKLTLSSPNTSPHNTTPNTDNNQSNPPTFTRRMSSQFVYQVERQKSVVDSIGLTDKINGIVPDEITRHIPGLNRRASQLKLTYFCNICFTKRAIDEGFTLRKCQHQFCPECMQGFMKSKIDNGVVNLTCFYPQEGTKPCGEPIDEEDIHQIVSNDTWEKFQKFKANVKNTYARQCPFCDHTQNGDPLHAIMTCENKECERQYCLYHSNAHPTEMSCEAYELTHAKETKMNEMVINEMGDNVKKCPQCKFTIIKNGGCNHMNCVKCGCSFCWLCEQIIEDEELPQHYKDPNSPCKGQQFTGMEGDPPPRWIMVLLVLCIIVFCIPSTVLGIAFGCLCFPFVLCCDCRNSETGQRQSLFETMFGCWLIWLIVFIVIAVFVPVVIVYSIWEVLKAIYAVIRICMPCLPRCPTGDANEDNQPQNVGGGENPQSNQSNIDRGNQGLLSDEQNIDIAVS